MLHSVPLPVIKETEYHYRFTTSTHIIIGLHDCMAARHTQLYCTSHLVRERVTLPWWTRRTGLPDFYFYNLYFLSVGSR